MSVIAELEIHPRGFELGRMLELDGSKTIELETMVPVGGKTVPFFWVFDEESEPFQRQVRRHDSVNNLAVVDEYEDRRLFALEWDPGEDRFFDGLAAVEAQILTASGRAQSWVFKLRFPSHDRLSSFQSYCTDSGIDFEVRRVYGAEGEQTRPAFGLTEPQREALTLALDRGYYAIPRDCTTVDLASELGISDQAVTERLRRAIRHLAEEAVVPVQDRPA
ncbi:helix-turn-helix domain-containing protein [Halobium salinum]|uniref:Helix-turn-helix domain-containing protein n=1 Tax=Halobium salinum TaxID=1364940 RepID=A0ABD5P8E8_9EURY|nr:helix-turn-helix domain-containing protein [Halobium salinum]